MGSRGRPHTLAGFALVLCSVLSLVACSLPGVNATSDAATILGQVQKIQLKDASFNASFTGTLSKDLGGGSGTASGGGKITTSPKRADIALNVDVNSLQVPVEVLLDADASDIYVTSPVVSVALGGNGMWLKLSLGGGNSGGSSTGGFSAGDFDITQILDFTQLVNVSLAGSESLDGIPVYHLKGADASSGQAATVDLYVRQDNYNPVRAILHINLFITGNLTLDFTAINSGASIAVPSADQILNK